MGDVRALNLWVSLSRCGDEAPGLDVVFCGINPGRVSAMRGTIGPLTAKGVPPMPVLDTFLDAMGNTPLVRLNRIVPAGAASFPA